MRIKNSRLYVPENFELPLDFPLRKECYIVVSAILRKKAILKYDYNGFVPISAQAFKNLGVRKLPEVLKSLEGVVQINKSYTVGENPRGYRLIENGDIKGIDMVTTHTATEDYLFQFQKGLTIDSTAAHNWNNDFNYNRASNIKAQNRFNSYRMVIDIIDNIPTESTYDIREGRRHTILSRTKKELLPFVRMDGEPLIEIDYKCFQPLISTVLFQQWFYDKRRKFNLWTFNNKMALKDKKSPQELELLSKRIKKILNKSYLTCNSQNKNVEVVDTLNDVLKYCTLCYTGLIYEYFVKTTRLEHDRKSIKVPTLIWMYQEGEPRDKNSIDMKKEFPTISEVFKLYKGMGSHSYLPVLLTRIETTIMFDRVIPRIQIELPNEPLDTKHDCILATKNEYVIENIMKEECTKVLRVEPILKVEPI